MIDFRNLWVGRWRRDGAPNRGLADDALSSDRTLDRFSEQFATFLRLHHDSGRRETVDWDDRYSCLDDATGATGFDRHYIYHPAWAARILSRTRPNEHTDISSTLHFCTLISAFIPTRFFDYRPAPVVLDGLEAGAADLVNLPFPDESIDSLSSMHVIEHIGLGRYGDPLDAMGDRKAANELQRVLRRRGNLLVVVPVGRPRIQFNAHRIYDHQDFRGWFSELDLMEFALVPDGETPDGLIVNPPSELVDAQMYGCGCYWFRKP